MHIERLDFENSPYLGVYGTATDKAVLIREGHGEKKLEVPVSYTHLTLPTIA
jgi:translation initiation factor 6